MKPRRQGLPSDSANLPVDVLRGRLAGLLGLPADIANLLRAPSPTEMFGDISYEAPAQFPYTTEKFLKDLPLAPTSRVGQLAGQAASFVPLNPMPAVRGVQKVGQAVGEELAATMMGQRPNTMMSKVVPQPLFAVPPEQGLLSVKTEPIENLLQVKPQAPVSDIGFYSATEQAALNLNRNKGTGQSFINDLMKAPDVKKEELQFTGLEDFLTNKPNVTKQEVQDFLANNRVDVKEVRKSDSANTYSAYGDDADGYFVYDPNGSREVAGPFKTMYEAEDKADRLTLGAAPKYEKYQLAGGNNYREILLTLPNQWEKPRAAQTANEARIQALRQEMYGTSGTDEIRSEISRLRNENTELQKQISEAPIYTSSHFDEPNILAHMRVNDRVDADGKKMLLVEEIQSDWHQAGREGGYKKNKSQMDAENLRLKKEHDSSVAQQSQLLNEEFKAIKQQMRSLPNQDTEQVLSLRAREKDILSELKTLSESDAPIAKNTGVPDAPFKDTWYQLALKRLTKYAADNGYERIGLTTGKQQAERFDLSQQIGQINARPTPDGKIALEAMTPDMRNQVFNKVVNANELDGIVGKEIAERIKNQIEYPKSFDDRGKSVELSGLDLQVGGEGMKKYYDEIYPKFLDKYGKKYGASVGETKVNTVMERADNSMIPKMGQESVRYLDITPKMKESTSKGQPLFAATPAIPAAGLLDEEKRKEITSLLE
jgi:hypothetical protein